MFQVGFFVQWFFYYRKDLISKEKEEFKVKSLKYPGILTSQKKLEGMVIAFLHFFVVERPERLKVGICRTPFFSSVRHLVVGFPDPLEMTKKTDSTVVSIPSS